uniref:exodeoxyribonuclease III n=1 Tax=Amphiprion ocellaris TaxID=80972 RepID=A0AAQ5XLZ7_AMPOC
MASKLIPILCPLLMLQLISFNTCGLRTEVKRADVLKEGRGKIMCLQETKWDEGLVEKVQKEWKGGIYTSNGTGTARGVAILVPEQLKETVKLIYKEKAGRIIIIDFQHNNENYRLINIHCPNIEGERKDFVRGLNKWVTNKTNCLIVGDFNICLTKLDSTKNNTYKNDTSRTELNKLMERNNLIDFQFFSIQFIYIAPITFKLSRDVEKRHTSHSRRHTVIQNTRKRNFRHNTNS